MSKKTITNIQCIDYIVCGYNHYWNMLGNMRGIQNHTENVDLNWLSGDVSCAYHIKFNGPDYEKEVANIAKKVKAGKLPGRLLITPYSAPSDIDICDMFLSHSGFGKEIDCGMAKELSAEAVLTVPPKNINLFRVSEIHQLKISGAIFNAAFNYDLFSFEHYLDAFNNPSVRFYMAEYNGIPAGACMSIWGDDFIEIAWVGTLPGYRRKGIAGYLISMAERDAVLKGRLISVLSAFPGAINAYSRIGYEKCCQINMICYDPA